MRDNSGKQFGSRTQDEDVALAVSEGSQPLTRHNSALVCDKDARPASRGFKRHLPLVIIVAIAFAARLIAMIMVQSWPLSAGSNIWKSGPEIVNIAQAIASRQGFSSPFGVPTGPTAWIPPVYPYIVAGMFLVLGIKSNVSAITILTMQSLFSALTCLPIYAIGKRALGEQVGRWAAWSWALFPYTVLIPVLFIWETALSALLVSILCYCCMQLDDLGTFSKIGVGMLWGLAAVTNTALICLLPVFLCWRFLSGRPHRQYLGTCLTVLCFCLLTISPWLWRNWQTLHTFVPIRSNFGEEFWLGNHEGGSGRIVSGLNPLESSRERERYRAVGEIAYVASQQRDALRFVRAHTANFYQFCWYRIQYWWFAKGESAPVFGLYVLLSLTSLGGMALGFLEKNKQAIMLSIAILVYPLVYYLTDVYARYRHPIEPLMVLLSAFLANKILDVRRRRSHYARTGLS